MCGHLRWSPSRARLLALTSTTQGPGEVGIVKRIVVSALAVSLVIGVGVAWAARSAPAPTYSGGSAGPPVVPPSITGTGSSDQADDTLVSVELQWFNPQPPPGKWEKVDRKSKLRKNVTNDGPGTPTAQHPVEAEVKRNNPPSGRYRTIVRFKKWVDTNGDGKLQSSELTENPGSPVTSPETVVP